MGHPPEPNPPPWPDSVIFISPDTPAEEVRRIVAPTEDPTYAYPDPSQVDPSTGTPRILTGHTSGRHFTEAAVRVARVDHRAAERLLLRVVDGGRWELGT